MKRIPFLLFLSMFSAAAAYAETDSQTIGVSFNVEPIFTTRVSALSGGKSISLGPLKIHNEIPTQSLRVSVVSNTSHRYKVYHRLSGNILSAEGSHVPREEVLFRISGCQKGGASSFPAFTAVPDGETVIFSSDGAPDTFTVEYLEANKSLIDPGIYHGDIDIEAQPD